jgi:hypothetical protein
MRTKHFLTAIILLLGVTFMSCEKDEGAKPEILNFELGYENSGIGYLGSDLHIEAEIIAEGKIDRVIIEIHHEGEHGKKTLSIVLDEHEWEVDTTYTKFYGLKNTNFHEHIDIPLWAEAGEYHFHMKVVDLEGNQTEKETELEIMAPEDSVPPTITINSAPRENQSYTNGETISIAGSVADDKALGGIYIGLVRISQNLTDAEVNATNTITLLHTHDFDNPTSYSFNASIVVGAAQDNNNTPKPITGDIAWQTADYYIVVKCKDAFGGNWTFSQHYPITISLE